MSGKPAARQGDATAKGGPVVQGSAGVFIGAPTGVACSVCPGGLTSGSPVNPLLGAKVLPGETDLSLPGPLPFVLTRAYSSYRTKTPAPAGLFGPGWKASPDIRLQLRDDALLLNDSGGRSIHFEPLFPGETAFSRSESFWLARGGVLTLPESDVLHALWQTLPETLRLSPHLYLATNSAQGPWWLLGWCERVPGADEVLPAPLPPYRVLTGLADRAGRMLTFHRDADGEFAGHITAVTDGAGRRFRLALTTLAAADAGYGPDSGVRLEAVWLTHDPVYPDSLPARPLARYAYTPRGELAAVYDRGGVQVRSFDYDEKYPGRMVAHAYAGRPQTTYRYDAAGRVTAQHNPAGLSYRYEYGRNRVVITDSLERRSVLHTAGEGGLKRVVREEQADGSLITREFNAAGGLTAQTDAAGRRTQYRLSPASGSLTAVVAPDGRVTEFYYNSQRQLTSVTHPDGLKSRQAFDDRGRLTQETSRHGDTTAWFYDGHSDWPSATEDTTGSRRQMTRNRYGQLLTFTGCSGDETRYEYDRYGQVTAVHQEEGLSQYRAYDARGRLIRETDAAGRETRYEYSGAGDLTAVIYPDGSRQTTEYDAAGRPVSVTAGGLTRRMAYDAAGRVIQLINENGAVTTFTYDLLDRLVQETGFDGRTQRYGYDLAGRLVRSEDENLITLLHYDEADRLTHRTVNGEPAEQWRYDERGWLTDISHLSGGQRVAVQYGYDKQGRMDLERQTVQHPETGELLWAHETRHARNAGLANRFKPDSLPAVEWLTYGSGYIAGMKLGDTPLLEFTRDRLHRETLRSYGKYELTTTYTPGGQLQGQHVSLPALNRDYTWNDAGQLVRIRGPRQQSDYGYDAAGRLISDPLRHYFTDPTGNRVTDPEQDPLLPPVWPDNRITQDADYFYHYDEHGRLREKDERAARSGGSYVHCYDYDTQHRLTHYRLMQGDATLKESRYGYDPLGRRICKRVRGSHRGYGDLPGQEYPKTPAVTWYGHDGDRLTTTQTDTTRIQTIYLPGSFTPLIRVETATAELAKTRRRSLAQKLEQDSGIAPVPELAPLLDRLEREILDGEVSEENRQWLARCGLTPEQMAAQVEPEYTPARRIHLYHCDHRGLPLALVRPDGETDWSAEYDAWGNVLAENNPHSLDQLIRLPGQQYDAETGLYYNRHRYYDPAQGRYITQDPIGLRGGWNLYTYPLDPIAVVDPKGLSEDFSAFTNAPGIQSELSKAMINEPWYMDASETSILMNTLSDMTNWGLAQSDQFFHCTAFCRVSKSRNANKSNALVMGVGKEFFDHAKNIFGLYGDGKRRDEVVMLLDNMDDLKVNHHGLTCPRDESCSSRCEGYLNPNHEKTKLFLRNKGYLDN